MLLIVFIIMFKYFQHIYEFSPKTLLLLNPPFLHVILVWPFRMLPQCPSVTQNSSHLLQSDMSKFRCDRHPYQEAEEFHDIRAIPWEPVPATFQGFHLGLAQQAKMAEQIRLPSSAQFRVEKKTKHPNTQSQRSPCPVCQRGCWG